MGINQQRQTPDDLFRVLDAEFHFDIDVAADAENRKCTRFINEETNAFVRPWFSVRERTHVAFCNPPWENIHVWFQRAYEETLRVHGSVAVVISHVTCSAKAVPWLRLADDVRFLVPRPQFKVPEGWWACPYCKTDYWDTNTESVAIACPRCDGLCRRYKDSSNPRDVQVTVFRNQYMKRHVWPEIDGPRFSYWEWKTK